MQGNVPESVAAYDSLWYQDGGGKHFSSDGCTDKDVVLIRYAAVLRAVGRPKDALWAFQHAMEDTYMREGLGDVPVSTNVTIDANNLQTEEFDRATTLALGVAVTWVNRVDEAIPVLEKAVHENSGSGLPYLYLADALQRPCKQEIRKQYGSPRAAYEKAAALGSAEVRASAKKWLRMCAPTSPMAK